MMPRRKAVGRTRNAAPRRALKSPWRVPGIVDIERIDSLLSDATGKGPKASGPPAGGGAGGQDPAGR